ncbi:hypothetical protein GOQ29_02680 [Clostridium sp. D2Q-14]|uniref:hypothetical protein n=1 Tax=Anaeromonas gelatinilytica TaxID=2683194 RepID=UPI00193C73EB|nr:hypothetical protein [Anaeromonas gelatinilytica]MBS4534515.1 hypothetical protein [Anaeromonas gelatinilytica]
MNKKILIYFILALIILSSCGNKEEKPNANNDKEKVPEELGKMQENSKTIIEDIEGIMKKTEEPIFVETKKEEKKEGQEDQSEGSESEGQGGGQEESGGGQQQGQQQPPEPTEEKSYEEKKKEENIKKQEEIEKMWMKLELIVSGVHTSWNNYKISAMEGGVNTKSLEATDKALNNLTINVGNKEIMTSLKEINKLIFSLANFFDIYKGHIDGDLNRLYYTASEVYIQSLEESWDKAQKVASEYEEYFSMLRQKIDLEKKDEKYLNKLEVSMKDLIDSLQYQDPNLVKIKREVVLQNIEKLNEVAK